MSPAPESLPYRAPESQPASTAVILILAAWLAAVVALGQAGTFVSTPTQRPLPILIAILGPPLVFVLAYRASSLVRDYALAIDLRWLTAVQGLRFAGIGFLALYSFGMLPGLFAWPAGVGDAAVGLAAPFVLLSILRESPGWQNRVWWLNVAGLLDFVGAVGTGVVTSESALGFFYEATPASMGALPLSLVPTFAVPLWIIFHMISLIQLRRIAP